MSSDLLNSNDDGNTGPGHLRIGWRVSGHLSGPLTEHCAPPSMGFRVSSDMVSPIGSLPEMYNPKIPDTAMLQSKEDCARTPPLR